MRQCAGAGGFGENSAESQQIVAAAELLGRLLLQDVERTDDGVSLKDGVSRDRMMSVHDPEMRHGHKSSSRRFDGHKAAIVVGTGTQLITAVEVLPGNAPDKWQEPATVQNHLADWMRLNPRGSELPMGEVVSLFTGPFLNSHCSIENCFNKDSAGPYMHNIANDTRWTVHHHE